MISLLTLGKIQMTETLESFVTNENTPDHVRCELTCCVFKNPLFLPDGNTASADALAIY